MKILETLREKMPKKLFTKKRLIILAVIVVVVGFAAYKLLFKPKDVSMDPPQTRTTIMNKTSLINSVSVTGNVKSINVVNVSTTLTSKVTEILVQVGDTVKKGDILAKLDSEEITKSINEERKKLNDTKATLQEALDKAVTKKEESETNVTKTENAHNAARAASGKAYSPYVVARDSIAVFQNKYNADAANVQALGLALNNSYAAMEAAKAAKRNADANVTAATQAVTDTTAAETAAKTAYDNESDPTKKAALKIIYDNATAAKTNATLAETNAKAAQTAAGTAETNATTAHGAAQTNYTNGETTSTASLKALNDAKVASNVDALLSTYKEADLKAEACNRDFDAAIKQRDADTDAYKTARKAVDEASTSKVLEDLDTKLKECTIKSETNGVITAINAVVGSAMGQNANAGTGPLAVIQDIDNLVISTSFKEYDIKNIQIGQKVTIKSDATGDKVITGYVSQISMTAASGQGGSDASFPAEIRIDGTDSGLLIGMNAKANVILSQKDNIFVAPDDAIGTNEKGEKVVYLQTGDTFVPVVVTTGVSNDFYTEIISSEITEGCIILSSAADKDTAVVGGGAAGGGMTGDTVAVDEVSGGAVGGGMAPGTGGIVTIG